MLRYSSALCWNVHLASDLGQKHLLGWKTIKAITLPRAGCCRENWRRFIICSGSESHPKCVIKHWRALPFSPTPRPPFTASIFGWLVSLQLLWHPNSDLRLIIWLVFRMGDEKQVYFFRTSCTLLCFLQFHPRPGKHPMYSEGHFHFKLKLKEDRNSCGISFW